MWLRNRRSVYVLAGSLAALVGSTLGVSHVVPVPSISVTWEGPTSASASYTIDSIPDLLLIYVGASNCRWSNMPELRAAVRSAVTQVSQEAKRMGLAFAAVGVARDWSVRNGLEHLRNIANFDEVVSGDGRYNLGLERYVYGPLGGEAATPQVVVVERRARSKNVLDDVKEHVLVRYIGLQRIVRWSELGAPLPHSVDTDLSRSGISESKADDSHATSSSVSPRRSRR